MEWHPCCPEQGCWVGGWITGYSIPVPQFGDLDPTSAEFFLQEERLAQMRSDYEQQCRVSGAETRLLCPPGASQNHLGWKNPSQMESSHSPSTNHVPKCHILTANSSTRKAGKLFPQKWLSLEGELAPGWAGRGSLEPCEFRVAVI